MQAHTPPSLSAEAAALAWLVSAGADALVDDAPRNWLAAPPAASPAPDSSVAPMAAMTSRSAMPARRSEPAHAGAAGAGVAAAVAAAARVAAAATDLAGLAAAVAGFDHPLRDSGTSPRLLEGATASGVVVIADMPDAAGSPAALLQARMLAAIGLDPARAAAAHLLPWPTPGGRPPREDEIAIFAPFLARALALAPPQMILALGDRAAALSGEVRGVASLRGRWLLAGDVRLLATFHPRRLLAQPDLKRLAWADLQVFAAHLESLS